MEEAWFWATTGGETTGAVFWSLVSTFIDDAALTTFIRSVIC